MMDGGMWRVECMMVVKHLLTRGRRKKVVRGTGRIEWGWLGRGKGAKDFFWAHMLHRIYPAQSSHVLLPSAITAPSMPC